MCYKVDSIKKVIKRFPRPPTKGEIQDRVNQNTKYGMGVWSINYYLKKGIKDGHIREVKDFGSPSRYDLTEGPC